MTTEKELRKAWADFTALANDGCYTVSLPQDTKGVLTLSVTAKGLAAEKAAQPKPKPFTKTKTDAPSSEESK